MKYIFFAAFLLLSSFCSAQQSLQSQNRVVRKITIKHADPALIMLILSGKTTPLTPSEISTVFRYFKF